MDTNKQNEFYRNQFQTLLKTPFDFQTWDIALNDKKFTQFLSQYHEFNKNSDTAYHVLARLAKKEVWNHVNVGKLAEKFHQFGVDFNYSHLNIRGLDAETLAYKEGNFLLGRALNKVGQIEFRQKTVTQLDVLESSQVTLEQDIDVSLNWDKVANPNIATREELADIQWNEKLSLNYGREVAYNHWLHT